GSTEAGTEAKAGLADGPPPGGPIFCILACHEKIPLHRSPRAVMNEMHDGDSPAPEDTAVLVRPRRKGIYILPNLFTLAALFGGFYAIVMAMNGQFEQAAYGIFIAAVLDS